MGDHTYNVEAVPPLVRAALAKCAVHDAERVARSITLLRDTPASWINQKAAQWRKVELEAGTGKAADLHYATLAMLGLAYLSTIIETERVPDHLTPRRRADAARAVKRRRAPDGLGTVIDVAA